MGTVRALATTAKQTLAERVGLDPQKLELLRDQLAPGAPDTVLELYFERCRLAGADPFARMFYAQQRKVKEGNDWKTRWTIETTIDGLRSIAEATGEYDGQSEPVFAYDPKGAVVSCSVTVWRKGMSHGVTASAFFAEFVQVNRDGEPGPIWRKMPRNQLAKCTEALALRKAFPRQLSGLYTGDEMAQADNPTEQRNVTPATAERKAQESPAEAPLDAPTGDNTPAQASASHAASNHVETATPGHDGAADAAQDDPTAPLTQVQYEHLKPVVDALPREIVAETLYALTGRVDDFTQLFGVEAHAAYVALRKVQIALAEAQP